MSTRMVPPDPASTSDLNTTAMAAVALSNGSLRLGCDSLMRSSASPRAGPINSATRAMQPAWARKDCVLRARRLSALLEILVLRAVPVRRGRGILKPQATLDIERRQAVAGMTFGQA